MFRALSIVIWGLFIIGATTLLLFIGSVVGNWNDWWGGMPDLDELANPKSEQASELYSADGVLLGKYFRENRSPVNYENLSPYLINALKATEDIRFEEHSGIDFIGTLGIIPALLSGQRRGASTITQQLAKNLFNTRNYKGSLSGFPGLGIASVKVKEWTLAIELEKKYTKDEIMTMYLNTVDFGSNAFGIKVASKTFFNNIPDSLSILQSATLVGLLKAPTYYSPILNPENALRRRNTVLQQMVKYNYLDKVAYDTISKVPILDADIYKVENHNSGRATYFRKVAGNFLLYWCKNRGIDLYSEGLKIYTTLDSRMQDYAEKAVEKHMKKQQAQFFDHWKGRNPWIDENGLELKGFLKKAVKRTARYKSLKKRFEGDSAKIDKVMNEKVPMTVFSWNSPTSEVDTMLSPVDSLKYYKHFLHIGMMAMDPHTGHIKSWVGGINHKYFKYDHVKQGRRQPGSTFKPIVYSVSIEQKKFHPCYQVLDAPITFTMHDGAVWTPKNSDKYSNSFITLRQAMARSINTVAAYLIKELSEGAQDGTKGASLVANYGKKFGINSPLDPIPSICLGSSDVSVYELVGAYSTFVNQGVWTEPIFITRIEDKKGKVIHQFIPKTVEVLSDETAYTMTYMLRGATEEKGGTALGLRRHEFIKDNQVGGKTGTTSNYSDAWFMGVTKDLVAGVWVGGDDRGIHYRSIRYGQGARQAMPAFAYFMDDVFADESLGYEKGEFPKPPTYNIELDCDEYQLQNGGYRPIELDSAASNSNDYQPEEEEDIF